MLLGEPKRQLGRGMALEDQHKGGVEKSSREFVVERVELCYYHVGLWAELRPRLFLGEHLTETWRKVGRQLLCHVENIVNGQSSLSDMAAL